MTTLHATEVGRRVALSGLLPETTHFILTYLAEQCDFLTSTLPDETGGGGKSSEFNYCLVNAALVSPEFEGLLRTRFIPYGFEAMAENPLAATLAATVAARPWQAHRSAANAAALLIEWIDGAPLTVVERRFKGVRAGTIEALCRDVLWCVSGVADVVSAATRPDLDVLERPTCLRNATAGTLASIRSLLPALRLLVARLAVGLPQAVLWMVQAQGPTGRPLVTRREALALHNRGLGGYDALRQRNNWADVIKALTEAGVTDAQRRAETIQRIAMKWHQEVRARMLSQQKRLAGKENHKKIDEYYASRGTTFEAKLEEILAIAGIGFTRFDIPSRTGAFDYLIHIEERSDIPLECKSKQGDSLVTYNEATDVLRATDVHGYTGANCVTVCQPGVDPNVPPLLVGCGRLCLVESHDLAEVLVRIALGKASSQDLHDWLSQPGQARLETFSAKSVSPAE